jgi:hypothetical protein
MSDKPFLDLDTRKDSVNSQRKEEKGVTEQIEREKREQEERERRRREENKPAQLS